MVKISDYALKSIRALKEDTVETVFDDAVVDFELFYLEGLKANYVGVKNTNVIPIKLIEDMVNKRYIIHTIDKMSHSGRAIDLKLINPITGQFMTGSSSATAINVFLNINDIGVGTDGGGSVLNPALALNLYSVMSPLFYHEELVKFKKISTDNISFIPSLGFIAKDYKILETLLEDLNFIESHTNSITVKRVKALTEQHKILEEKIKHYESIQVDYYDSKRSNLINEINKIDFDKTILISYEGPIDVETYGDSVMGHYDQSTKRRQIQGNKFLSKVINMAGLSGITVPSSQLSCGYLIIFKSDKEKLFTAMKVAENIKFNRSKLEEDYFSLERGMKENGFIKRWIYPHS